MGMNRVPTLILGIGGIGCRIAANLKELLPAEARDHIAIVGMDTNVNDLAQLNSSGMRTIQTSDDRTVGDYMIAHPEHMRWFPINKFIVSRTMLNGAGQVRAISRLAALASEENGKFVPIREELQRIRANRGEQNNGNLTVMVVGSITGGTGAGLFLQMPYYIRKVLKSESGLKNIIIRGMFIGPDFTAGVQPSKINREAVHVNAYACMKELNALYRLQTKEAGPGGLKVDFYTPDIESPRSVVEEMWDSIESDSFEEQDFDAEAFRHDTSVVAEGNPEIPYDYLYLIENATADATTGEEPLPGIEKLVARMVFTLMFTPVRENALSVEDNMVLADIKKGGMNRYSSAGLCSIVYPRDLAREYVALSAVRDLVREEWLVIEDAYSDTVTQRRIQQRTDRTIEIPKMKDFFVTEFKKQAKGSGRLGKLYRESFEVNVNNTQGEIARSTTYLKGMTRLIEEIVSSDDVSAARDACLPNLGNSNTFSTAASTIADVYTALTEYRKMAELLIEQRSASIANQMFPPSWASLMHQGDKTNGLYEMLGSVHPLTACFFCYSAMQFLEKKIAMLEGQFNGIDLDGYLEEDFYEKEEGVQSADEALSRLEEKSNAVTGMLGTDAKRIHRIMSKMTAIAEDQSGKITQMLRTGLELEISRILLSRMKQLVEQYQVFFQNLRAKIESNDRRIAHLEELQMSQSQIGIYYSKEAFRLMAAEYRSHMDGDLPDKTKKAIFEAIFKELAIDFDKAGLPQTERQKEKRAEEKAAALGSVFETAVVETIREEVIERGGQIVDLDIYSALKKQYDLECPEGIDFTTYLRQTVEKGMRKAAPMLAVSTNAMAENTQTVYMAIHPNCAAVEDGKASVAATQKLYVPQACEATDGLKATVLMDTDFSPYEIVCFKARYKFSIEDLVKYSWVSENAKYYRKRIEGLGKRLTAAGPDAGLSVTSPHLDRYWHEEAYLPEIYAYHERVRQLETRKAFIYAMGLDCFSVLEGEFLDGKGQPGKSWYLFVGGRYIPVKVRGNHIGSTYTDLYNALPFNGKIKRYILNLAKTEEKSVKGNMDAEELCETILQTAFIEDLIQSTPDKQGSDRNILDILLMMRSSMPAAEWKTLFDGLREVLWDYCAALLDKNEHMVNDVVRKIIDRMLENCEAGKKPEAELTYGEKALLGHVSEIRRAVYRQH